MPAFLSYRGIVAPSDCDVLGHMNVSRYFAACGDAGFAIQSEMGLTARDMAQGRRLSFAVVHTEAQFHAELVAGDGIYMLTETLATGTRSMTFRHRLYRAEDDKLSFEAVFKCVMLDLVARRSVPVPGDLRAAADRFRAGSG